MRKATAVAMVFTLLTFGCDEGEAPRPECLNAAAALRMVQQGQEPMFGSADVVGCVLPNPWEDERRLACSLVNTMKVVRTCAEDDGSYCDATSMYFHNQALAVADDADETLQQLIDCLDPP